MIGIFVSIGLVVMGAVLLLGVNGALGARAPDWIVAMTLVPVAGLVVLWLPLAAFAADIPRDLRMWVVALALCPVASIAGLAVLGIAVHDYYTNATVLPQMVLTLLLWVSVPFCLAALVLASGVGDRRHGDSRAVSSRSTGTP